MSFSVKQIISDLKALGIKSGDTIMMHSSYKSLGEIDGGAKTLFDGIFTVLGENGTLLMPAFSFDTVDANNPHFNKLTTPCCVGYLPEFFRTNLNGVERSVHPTHSCTAKGRLAKELTCEHYKDRTPVGKNSPITKLKQVNGKILFLGCSSDRNTSIHGVEELTVPPYLFEKEKTEFYINDGEKVMVATHTTHRHFIQHYSKIEQLLEKGEIERGKVLKADCVLLNAKAVWEKGNAKLKEDPFFFVDKNECLKGI